MPDLGKLRELRDRADVLLKHVKTDLSPFLHERDRVTFRRTPTSESDEGDVNVTTTCSCLMALALTNEIKNLYEQGSDDAKLAFRKLVEAPWMSSGLTANNAFTTALVIRALGFLIEANVLEKPAATAPGSKEWELHLGIKDLNGLLRKLKAAKSPASKFLWSSISDKARTEISKRKRAAAGADSKRLLSLIALELSRVMESGSIYEPSRFPAASAVTKNLLSAKKIKTYGLAAANYRLLIDTFPKELKQPEKHSFADIAKAMSAHEDNFTINEYPPAVAVVYWFVDGVSRAQIKLPAKNWLQLCNWATKEFNHKRSLVAAQQEAMMDPVAMAMAACLCARLRAISDRSSRRSINLGAGKDHLAILPSRGELEHSISQLFAYQKNGIWPKYFPLFHYQDAGSNFCFTFELLEAVLCEFGRPENDLPDNDKFIAGLEQALDWCERGWLKSSAKKKQYAGWNSGGYLETLRKGQPESWATAVVHMFLWELQHVLSNRIQTRVLKEYNAQLPFPSAPGIKDLLDIEVLEKGKSKGLKSILRSTLVKHYKKETEDSLKKRIIKVPRSALLFGPPGTSKTKVTEAVAKDLKWPLIQIDPSHFLKESLDRIYLQAEKVFSDLMDLSAVVVLFDEMDALVQTRDTAIKPDTASQFLTTFMLPKLTRLHDKGRVVFFMATNYQDRFDAAIKRAGRFDLLLCMGPPTLKEKLKGFHLFVGEKQPTPQTRKAARYLSKYAEKDSTIGMQLELYTFGEFQSLIRELVGKDTQVCGDKIKDLKLEGFADRFETDKKFVGLRLADLEPLSKLALPECRTLKDIDHLEITRKQVEKAKIEVTPIIRYVLDRAESRRQGE